MIEQQRPDKFSRRDATVATLFARGAFVLLPGSIISRYRVFEEESRESIIHSEWLMTIYFPCVMCISCESRVRFSYMGYDAIWGRKEIPGLGDRAGSNQGRI